MVGIQTKAGRSGHHTVGPPPPGVDVAPAPAPLSPVLRGNANVDPNDERGHANSILHGRSGGGRYSAGGGGRSTGRGVHDPTRLRLNPPETVFEHGGTTLDQACRKGGTNEHGDADYKMLREMNLYGGEFHPSSKLMCTIYTYEKHHDMAVPALRETWGKRCDGFMASSTGEQVAANG